jgi:hypothetical protein
LFRVNHGKKEFALKGYKENFDLHLKDCKWSWNHSPAEKSQPKKDLEKYVFNLETDLYNILNIHQVLKSYLMFNFNWSGS